MQLINFYHFFVILFFLAQQTLSFSIGDYVEIDDNSKAPIYGTIVKIKDNNLVTIRPHRFQGDFDITSSEVKIIKTAQNISKLAPKPNQYSINLMWINNNASNTQSEHIFPNDATLDKILDTATQWAPKNPGAEVIVWYDSAMLSRTQKSIPEKERIIFKDIRKENFPEVIKDPETFSDNTPVFFRVDLLRAIIAYNILKNKDNKYYFVYADIDVETMSKDQLFDASTIMDLDTYGIVMARGGLNGLENSFQIWSNTQEKFLNVAKSIIIDRSMKQKKYVDEGNSLLLGSKDIQQQVYNNYFFMFPYYYSLQKWCALDKYADVAFIELSSGKPLCHNTEKEHLYIEKYFKEDGELMQIEGIYFPSKIINAPKSQFGGTPEKVEPNTLNSMNYSQKLEDELKNKPIDNYFLQIALQNNYDDSLEQIKKSLNKNELAEALLSLDKHENIPLIAAINNKKIELSIELINNILNKEEEGIEKIKNILIDELKNTLENENNDSLEILLKIFTNNTKLQEMFFEGLNENPNEGHVDNIILNFNIAKITEGLNLINNDKFMSGLAETLEKKDEDGNNFFHRIALKKRVSKDKSIYIEKELKSLFIKYPELLKNALNATNNENKTSLQLVTFPHKKNMIENLLNFSMKSVN